MTGPFLGWLNQPFFSEQYGITSDDKNLIFKLNSYCLILKGQIYEQGGSGLPLAAETLLEAYRAQGPQCLTRFSGQFAFAIISYEKQEVFLARDKIGTYALYCCSQNNSFTFSDHCHYLSAHLPSQPPIRLQSIFDYFYFHFVPSPQTLYEGIVAIEPGHYALFRKGQLKIIPYWKPHYSQFDGRSFKEKGTQLKSLLKNAISPHHQKENVGCFLSGGIDSSTVLGYLSEQGKRKIKAFSIGFDAEKFNEISYAEIAAKHFHAEHITYHVTPQDIIDKLPIIVSHLEQPFGNASLLPTYFCAQLAKENGVDHLLAGDGGDELFGGNTRYAIQARFTHYHLLPKFLRQGFLEPLAAWLPDSQNNSFFAKYKSYISQANMPMPDRQERYNLISRIGPPNIFTRDFLHFIDEKASLAMQRAHYAEADASTLLSRMLSLDMKFTLADNDLRKVVTACEQNLIQVHFPFLDEQLVQFALRLPDQDKIKDGQLRYFYKKAMSDFLPKKIIAKTKHGFGLPFGVWLTQHAGLKGYIFSQLSMLKLRGIVQSRFIDELMNTLLKEHPSYYGVMAWTLAVFELWMQTHPILAISPQRSRTQKTKIVFDNEVA
ncbi:MAG: asparagine synthase-related protein [Gammaproteobacteria bacterium]